MLKAGGGLRGGIQATLILLTSCLAARAGPVVVAQVTDGESKKPLAGAVVMVEGSDIMAVTDSGGRCQVVVAPRKGGALVASRPGYLDLALTSVWPAKSGQDTVVIDFPLYPNRPRVVAGRVTDAGTKLAITGATVSVEDSELAESTRADGGFIFGNFPAGPRKVEASYAGYPPKAVLVEAKGGETTEVNLALVDTSNVGRVAGIVSDARSREPVQGARVAVEGTGLDTVTDSLGQYALDNVPAGMHKLIVSSAGYVNAYTVVRLVKDWAVTVNLYLREATPQVPKK